MNPPTPSPLFYAILADGGFVRRKLGTEARPMVAEDFKRFVDALRAHPALAPHQLHRIYYYDAKAMTGQAKNPISGRKINFAAQPAARQSREFCEGVAQIPHVSLRMGETSNPAGQWEIKPAVLAAARRGMVLQAEDLKPKIAQKGVDMRLGLDIASLTLKRQARIIALVTGDSDFVPAMKFARREGAQVFLVPLGHKIRDSMREHADLVLDNFAPTTP